MACAYITDLATFIWHNLGQPTDVSVPSIQSKLVSSPYVGNFNNLAATCYVPVSGDIVPQLGPAEQAIYASLYERDWYTMKLNQVLAGFGTSFTTLQEGDSRISRSSTADVARVYRDMQNQLNLQLEMLLATYRQNRSLPESIIYPTIISVAGAGANMGWPQNYYRS